MQKVDKISNHRIIDDIHFPNGTFWLLWTGSIYIILLLRNSILGKGTNLKYKWLILEAYIVYKDSSNRRIYSEKNRKGLSILGALNLIFRLLIWLQYRLLSFMHK